MGIERFERQLRLRGFGEEAQARLRNARVLVVGAGGLGCPALLYLAACGVGHIGIVDGDRVSPSNLHRQVLFGESDLGKLKAEVAARELMTRYSDLSISVIPEFLNTQNAIEQIERYDLVVDGSDNFQTRYLVNDACVLLGKPLVWGAIYQNEGQVALFNAETATGRSTNYRDLYPKPPKASEIPNCNETGVLGVLPGIIGTLQAAEAVKYLSRFGTPLLDRLLIYDLLSASFYELAIVPHPEAHRRMPASIDDFEEMDYSVECGISETMTWTAARQLYQQQPERSLWLDVREPHERPLLQGLPYLSLPMAQLAQQAQQPALQTADYILIFCHAGIRSLRAVEYLKTLYPSKQIYSIKGGMQDAASPANTPHHGTKT